MTAPPDSQFRAGMFLGRAALPPRVPGQPVRSVRRRGADDRPGVVTGPRVLAILQGVAAAILMPAGSWLLVSLDPEVIARMIAVVVLVFSIVLMVGWRYEGEKKLWSTLGAGAFGKVTRVVGNGRISTGP